MKTKLEMRELLDRCVIPATTQFQGKTVRQFPGGWINDETPYARIRGGFVEDGKVHLLCETPTGQLFKTHIELIQLVPKNELPPDKPVPHSEWSRRTP